MNNNPTLTTAEDEGEEEGPGKPVLVQLEPELLDSLPTLPLSIVTHPLLVPATCCYYWTVAVAIFISK